MKGIAMFLLNTSSQPCVEAMLKTLLLNFGQLLLSPLKIGYYFTSSFTLCISEVVLEFMAENGVIGNTLGCIGAELYGHLRSKIGRMPFFMQIEFFLARLIYINIQKKLQN